MEQNPFAESGSSPPGSADPSLVRLLADKRAELEALERRLARGQDPQLLTTDEVAARLNVSRRWVYHHSKRWPFTRRLSRKVLRFSKAGFEKWLAQRGGA